MIEQLAAYYAQNEGKRALQDQLEPAVQDWPQDEQAQPNNSQNQSEETSGAGRLQRWFSNLTQPKQA